MRRLTPGLTHMWPTAHRGLANMSSDFFNTARVFAKQHWEDGDKWYEPPCTDHKQLPCVTVEPTRRVWGNGSENTGRWWKQSWLRQAKNSNTEYFNARNVLLKFLVMIKLSRNCATHNGTSDYVPFTKFKALIIHWMEFIDLCVDTCDVRKCHPTRNTLYCCQQEQPRNVKTGGKNV